MTIVRVFFIGGRIIIGLLLAATMVYMTSIFDWRSADHAWLGPLGLPILLTLATLGVLLVRSFYRATLLELAIMLVMIFVLECLMIPGVPGHAPSPRPQLAPNTEPE